MIKINKDKYNNQCKDLAATFFGLASKAVCSSSEQISEVLASNKGKMIDGIWFHTSQNLNKASLKLAEKLVGITGLENGDIEVFNDINYKTIVGLISENPQTDATIFTETLYTETLYKEVSDYLDITYSYLGPCAFFRFEDCKPELISKYISVMNAENFLNSGAMPKSGQNWYFESGATFDNALSSKVNDGKFIYTIGGICWVITTDVPKVNVRQQARWMTDVLISLIRLGIKPADYCHRARLGKVEGNLFTPMTNQDPSFIFNDQSWSGAGSSLAPMYKIDQRFADDFHSEKFQEKIQQIFDANPKSLAKRVSNGLSWLSRGRQNADPSERLLCFFTALESLLSEKGSFTPVADSIARYASIIIANKPSDREAIHTELKKLYNLRSDLVHRGNRSAHNLNSNNVEYFVENCFFTILKDVDMALSHEKFIGELKEASHGTKWPKR